MPDDAPLEPNSDAHTARVVPGIPDATNTRSLTQAPVLVVVVIDIACIVLGLFGSNWGIDPYVAYALSVAAVGIATFCGFYYMARTMSDAIAASFVLVYFVITSYLLFLPGVRGGLTGSKGGALTDTGRELISNLTTFVTIIVSTYFFAEAVERGVTKAIVRRSSGG
jgi:hypothetical protein